MRGLINCIMTKMDYLHSWNENFNDAPMTFPFYFVCLCVFFISSISIMSCLEGSIVCPTKFAWCNTMNACLLFFRVSSFGFSPRSTNFQVVYDTLASVHVWEGGAPIFCLLVTLVSKRSFEFWFVCLLNGRLPAGRKVNILSLGILPHIWGWYWF